jgi:hypothetical protein
MRYRPAVQEKPAFGSGINWGSALANGIKACWLLNSQSGTVIDIAGHNHGSSDAVWHPEGIDFSTSATNRVLCSSGSPVTTNRITVAAWIRPSVATRGDLVTCWNQGTTGSQFNLLYGLTSGKAAFFVSGGSAPTLINSGDSTQVMSAGQVYLVVGTYDGSLARVYVNGALGASGGSAITLNTASLVAVRLGDNAFGDGNYNGRMHSAVIWDRALSADQVAWLYAEPCSFIEPPQPRRVYSVASAGGSALPVFLHHYRQMGIL